jgi:hypothetical protein
MFISIKKIAIQLVSKTSDISHNKFWTNIAYLCATGVYVWQGIHAQKADEMVELSFVYLAIVAGNTTANKLIELKHSKKSTNENEENGVQ